MRNAPRGDSKRTADWRYIGQSVGQASKRIVGSYKRIIMLIWGPMMATEACKDNKRGVTAQCTGGGGG